MKKDTVKTKRLVIEPMSDEETEDLIRHSDSEESRKAYEEMLQGSRNDSENRVWYTPWKMMLKDSRTYIGDLCFKGSASGHAVEIGYGILPEYEGKGYTTEAVQAMTRWAFSQKDVVFVEAETDPYNAASQRVLEKCGFAADGIGEEGPRFVLECPMTNWSAIYMLFGMSIGMSIGQMQNQMVFGMSIGMSLGVLVGLGLYAAEKKKREELRGKRIESERS